MNIELTVKAYMLQHSSHISVGICQSWVVVWLGSWTIHTGSRLTVALWLSITSSSVGQLSITQKAVPSLAWSRAVEIDAHDTSEVSATAEAPEAGWYWLCAPDAEFLVLVGGFPECLLLRSEEEEEEEEAEEEAELLSVLATAVLQRGITANASTFEQEAVR